jgi:hypothetical protein
MIKGSEEEFMLQILEEHGQLNFNLEHTMDIPYAEITVVEMAKSSVSFRNLDKQYYEEHKRHQAMRKEDKERAQYELLKAKFEKE